MTEEKTAVKTNGGNGSDKGAPEMEALKEEITSAFSEPAPEGAGGGEKRTVAAILGEVTWLLTQSQRHKNFFLSDLEWMAMTPILLKQFRLFYGKDRPIGVVLWAKVDEEVEARLKSGNAKLRPQDWKCGSKLWVVDIIAPYGGFDEMLKDLKANVFKDQEFKYLALEGGKAAVKTM